MSNESEEEYFDKRWLKQSKDEEAAAPDLRAIKEFAYRSFDQLDKDGDGFLQRTELKEELESGRLDSREKSFVTFLLNSHEQIASMNDDATHAEGISRQDIEYYFSLIAELL